MANRLINEQSPYLHQHAHNPVDWYPWGNEAFERAKRENKPILVSIGYAACHWCHVMERESFEDEATAAYMNGHFINIKVDREEHPDVDHMYMDAVQAISQQGGWPLNVFVTPERVPFYGGTYYPPRPLYGRASWLQVLQRMHEVWTTQQDEVKAQTGQMLNYLRQLSSVAFEGGKAWDSSACRAAADNMLAMADKEYGGFGNAPKFPAATTIIYLLEHYRYTGYQPALEQALKSLDAMAAGGIYDQLGGGFARYSTDKYWLAPHFEKMLYDNALLVEAYSVAYTVTGNKNYSRIVNETIAFVNRELSSPGGGFYCALDADSEGEEGKFYTWTWDEWIAATGGDALAEQYFGIVKEGNWEGTNILHITRSLNDLAEENNLDFQEAEKRIKRVKQKLQDEQKKRVRPATDDKCLLSWNALMNAAFVKAGRVFKNDDWIKQAQSHMQWMLNSYLRDGRLLHTWKNGVAKIEAKLDDYAYLIAAILQLASVSSDSSLIIKAAELLETTNKEFLNEDKVFFYYSSANQQDIPARKTDVQDGSTPSANSIMAANLVVLGMLMERSEWIEQGRFMLNKMQGATTRYATSFSSWAIASQRMVAGYSTVVIAGPASEAIFEALNASTLPHCYVIAATGPSRDIPVLSGKFEAGKTQIFVCDSDSCRMAAGDVQAVRQMLEVNL